MTNKFPFETWEKLTNKIVWFFISTQTQTYAIERLTKLKQESRLLKDYQTEFTTWRELSGYNKITLVGLFKKEIYPTLAQKLIEIGQLKNSDSLDNWYEKALSFEKSRRKVIEKFKEKGKRILITENLGRDIKMRLVSER